MKKHDFKIGDKCYVVDNSFSHKLGESKHANLAGDIYTDPVLVSVMSEPYEKEIEYFDLKFMEFINVEYNGEIYEVLNILTSHFESAEEYRITMDYYDKMIWE